MRLVDLRPLAVEIAAPRELVFEIASAVDAKLPNGPSHQASLVERNGEVMVVRYRLAGRRGPVELLERVTLTPPQRIDYERISGPLDHVSEWLTFEEQGRRLTVVRYGGQVGRRLPLLGPLIVRMLAVPAYERLMYRSLRSLKETAEARVSRSRRRRQHRSARDPDLPR